MGMWPVVLFALWLWLTYHRVALPTTSTAHHSQTPTIMIGSGCSQQQRCNDRQKERGSKIQKYWNRRYKLFSRFDEGILLDEEGFWSVTPEILAKHQARRCRTGKILDAFAGCGGNAIAFANEGANVTAIDISYDRLKLLRHNARIYGIGEEKISIIQGDFVNLAKNHRLKADIVFLSPPWGGPEYRSKGAFDFHSLLPGPNATMATLIDISRNIVREKHKGGVVCYLPKNINLKQLEGIVRGKWELEESCIDGFSVGYTLYTDALAISRTNSKS